MKIQFNQIHLLIYTTKKYEYDIIIDDQSDLLCGLNFKNGGNLGK